jgi:hypothetical protein
MWDIRVTYINKSRYMHGEGKVHSAFTSTTTNIGVFTAVSGTRRYREYNEQQCEKQKICFKWILVLCVPKLFHQTSHGC